VGRGRRDGFADQAGGPGEVKLSRPAMLEMGPRGRGWGRCQGRRSSAPPGDAVEAEVDANARWIWPTEAETSRMRRLGWVAEMVKALGLGIGEQGLVILFGGPEALGELAGSKPMTVIGIGWVVELVEEGVEFGLIAQGEADGEVEARIGGELGKGFEVAGGRWELSTDGLIRLGWRREGQDEEHGGERPERNSKSGLHTGGYKGRAGGQTNGLDRTEHQEKRKGFNTKETKETKGTKKTIALDLSGGRFLIRLTHSQIDVRFWRHGDHVLGKATLVPSTIRPMKTINLTAGLLVNCAMAMSVCGEDFLPGW